MAGIQSPGTLWTWGSNVNFALGYNSTSYTSYPQQLGASNAWTGFPTGSQNNIWGAAINSNNNLYVWGVNSNRILNFRNYLNEYCEIIFVYSEDNGYDIYKLSDLLYKIYPNKKFTFLKI